MSPEELSDAIIEFEVKNNVNDTALAFSSHLSVEKLHAMKTGEAKIHYGRSGTSFRLYSS